MGRRSNAEAQSDPPYGLGDHFFGIAPMGKGVLLAFTYEYDIALTVSTPVLEDRAA